MAGGEVETLAEIGRVLGDFHRLTAQANAREFAVALPGFHDSPTYLAALDRVLAGIDPEVFAGEGPRVSAALDFIATRRTLVPMLAEAREASVLPVRVVHGDPKLDNVLFAADGDRALCLIDLGRNVEAARLALSALAPRLPEYGRAVASYVDDLELD